MYVVIVDIFAAIFIAGGIAVVVGWPRRSKPVRTQGEPQAGTYARRIGGTMIATFGLALGLMVTLFHFAGG